jgi:hypothetical protein
MYEEDYYRDLNEDNLLDNRINKMLEQTKQVDKGFNKILIKDENDKQKKITLYSSGQIGTRIRDAETGDYYSSLVGSKDEDLYYKVSWATGNCKSLNGSNIMFFNSPEHFMNHSKISLNEEVIDAWELKRNARLSENRKKIDVI